MPTIYNKQQAMDYLDICRQAFYKYLNDPTMPLHGQLLSPRMQVFTEEELNYFKAYMQTEDFKQRTKPGRKVNPDAAPKRRRRRS